MGFNLVYIYNKMNDYLIIKDIIKNIFKIYLN